VTQDIEREGEDTVEQVGLLGNQIVWHLDRVLEPPIRALGCTLYRQRAIIIQNDHEYASWLYRTLSI
jgi:hypothetical protein